MSKNVDALLAAWGRIVTARLDDPTNLAPMTDKENAILDNLIALGIDEDEVDEYALVALNS